MICGLDTLLQIEEWHLIHCVNDFTHVKYFSRKFSACDYTSFLVLYLSYSKRIFGRSISVKLAEMKFPKINFHSHVFLTQQDIKCVVGKSPNFWTPATVNYLGFQLAWPFTLRLECWLCYKRFPSNNVRAITCKPTFYFYTYWQHCWECFCCINK